MALSFHVTYGDKGWQRGDRNKWKDTFASKEADKRHEPYMLGGKNMSIPNFVVDNRSIRPSFETQMPQAKKAEVRRAIDAALKQQAMFDFSGEISSSPGARQNRESVRLDLALSLLEENAAPEKEMVVRALLLQKEASITPRSGWNKGKRLVDHYVVIDFHKEMAAGDVLDAGSSEIAFELPELQRPSDYAIAVLVENKRTGKTLDARIFVFPDQP